MYGPVAGSGLVPASLGGVAAGTTFANGTASFWRKLASGSASLKVIVIAASSAVMPAPRSQVFRLGRLCADVAADDAA